MGGLAAAARLAMLGHDVVVCEQAPVVGGKLGVLERDGFRFDTGPSLVTLPQVFRDLFLKTRGPLEKVLDLVPVEPIARYRFGDGTWLDLPNTGALDVDAALDAALGPGTGAQWRAFMDRAARIWDATRRDFVEAPLAGPKTLARLALRRPGDIRTVAPLRTLRGLGRHYLRDPRLQVLLDRYATYTGSDPRRAPAALAVVPYVEQRFGAYYVRGGLRVLGEAIHQRALDRGAVVVTGTEVVEITTSAGRVDGVRCADGRRLPADVVVANADASAVYGRMVTAPREQRRLRRAEPSYSGFVLLLALRGRTPGLAHHTVLFPTDYDAEFDALAAGRIVDDPTIYVSAPDDPALRPDGHEAWFVLVNAPRHGQGNGQGNGQVDWDSPGLADGYADRLLALLAERGLEVRDRLLWREVRTPADLERETRAPGGAIYGTSSNGPRAAFLRPANRSSVPGLFLVGGSAHPGGGLPLVTQSAAIVAELVGPA